MGFDNFSIRALGWKADRLIEYADRQKVDSLLFSDLQVYESHDEKYLREIGEEARTKDLILHAGTGGICPTSQSFKDTFGSADEHLQLLLKVAHGVGSKVARCYLGSMKDRKGPGGIERHVESTLVALKRIRPLALDLGIRLAIENHAGDLHSRELKELVERAGPILLGSPWIRAIRPGPWRIHWKPFEIWLPMQFAVAFGTPWFGPAKKGSRCNGRLWEKVAST